MYAKNNSNNNSVIWTDNDNARSLIWRSYWGFVDSFDNYMMYKDLKRTHPIHKAGIYRYASSFWYEVVDLLDVFAHKPISFVDEVRSFFERSDVFECDEDIVKFRRFASSFLFHSGMKSIVFQKDGRSGIEKVSAKYKLD